MFSLVFITAFPLLWWHHGVVWGVTPSWSPLSLSAGGNVLKGGIFPSWWTEEGGSAAGLEEVSNQVVRGHVVETVGASIAESCPNDNQPKQGTSVSTTVRNWILPTASWASWKILNSGDCSVVACKTQSRPVQMPVHEHFQIINKCFLAVRILLICYSPI